MPWRKKRRRKKGPSLTIEEGYQKMKELINSLIKSGYKLPEIYGMTLADIDFLIEVSNVEETKEEELVTLDQAFPFLF